PLPFKHPRKPPTQINHVRYDLVWVQQVNLREGFIVTLAGLAIGVAAAFGLTRLIANLLYGVTPMDPVTIAAVAVLLTAVAMLACVIPARHAANADPLRALRTV